MYTIQKPFILLLLIFSLAQRTAAQIQSCTTAGQTPATAFPVCGTSVFSQETVPYCGGTPIPGPCSKDGVTDTNPFFYKFTCFSGGTLGFDITPYDLNDDYDWQLFDVTGRNPLDIYSDANLFVACNWSGNFGKTGAKAGGTSLINCGGPSYPTYSQMPILKTGHNYILLVSHFTTFTPSQKGYDLSFNGGTASITDTTKPKMVSATASCGGLILTIALNKRMKCGSLDIDGSDFAITPAAAAISGANGNYCNGGFDMDTVILRLSGSLPPGNYTITSKVGPDNNTITDACDQEIPVGSSIPLVVQAVAPTPMDSITPVACAPNKLQLVFRKNIYCPSIAVDGSDFTVTGPSGVTVTGASGLVCNNDLSKVIQLTLSGPIVVQGTYTIHLQNGTDGNTITDECGQETPPSSIDFFAADTVNAGFTYQLLLGCKADTLQLLHDGRNHVNFWAWDFNGEGSSPIANPRFAFPTYGPKKVSLLVSNGTCKDTSSVQVNLDNQVKAIFGLPDILCPEDKATFTDSSIGRNLTWNWDFGNNTGSTLQNPPAQKFQPPATGRKFNYPIRLIVSDGVCTDTVTHLLPVLNTCYITVPNAFTPNGDGNNDFLYPLNAYKADNLIFRIYNRFGQLVYQTRDWTKKWDGTVGGKIQPPGAYAWTLEFFDRESGKKIFQKGTSLLIR